MSDSITPVHNEVTSGTTTTTSANTSTNINPSVATTAEPRRSSLAATPNPNAATDSTSTSTPPTSSVGQQNAPGRAGSIGEAAMGALGYGGSTVERPKEEQGIGEKIVNFLGA